MSVIIPLYNTEKYIGEALDSLLAQTFTNFEVIVVNDCSTDNSAAIVESYIPKFDGRLKLLHMKKNSGGAPAPRNKGLKFSSGEYVYFMDADDALVPTALEELYSVANDFEADVVHCDRYYSSPDESASTDKSNLKVTVNDSRTPLFEMATVEAESLKERVEKLVQGRVWWTPWSHLIKREFLLENDLAFPKLNVADDLMFTIYLYCTTGKFVLAPNAVYVWRVLKDSNSRADWTSIQLENFLHRRVNDIFFGIQLIDKFTRNFDLFQKEPQYKYLLTEFFVHLQINHIRDLYRQMPAIMFDDFIRKEFSAISNDPAVAAFLFNRMMTSDVQFTTIYVNQINKFNQFAAQAQKRIAELEAQLKTK